MGGGQEFHQDFLYAEELVALAPDVLLASGTQAVVAFQRVTRSVPIVFDPALASNIGQFKALGLEIPSSLLTTADEVIE
jgi:hypothetical protein